MKYYRSSLSCLLITISVWITAPSARAGTDEIHVKDDLALDDKALGHIRHMVRITGHPGEEAGRRLEEELRARVTDGDADAESTILSFALEHFFDDVAERVLRTRAGAAQPTQPPSPSGS